MLGSLIGFLGAGGQLLPFEALRLGPAYIVPPVISLSPVVTILLSVGVLREKASARGWTGIALGLASSQSQGARRPCEPPVGQSGKDETWAPTATGRGTTNPCCRRPSSWLRAT
jgi:hypothetical protein